MKNTKSDIATKYSDGKSMKTEQELILEEPLGIHVDGKPYSVIMRTPGNEIFHAAGFCLAEGLVDSKDDFSAIGHCPNMDSNVITVTLTTERRKKIPDLLERKGFVSQTSFGICGKALIKDLDQVVTPITDSTSINIKSAFDCIDQLTENQKLYGKTFSAHAAMLLDKDLKSVSFDEDVGRHNALDKTIGFALMNQKLDTAKIGVLTSRLSYELIQKAARAKIPILVTISRPTELAVRLSRLMNIAVARVRKNETLVFCGKERFGNI